MLIAVLLWGQAALAQSHVPIPPRPGQPDLEKVFEERFGRALAIDDMAKILEKLYPQLSREDLLRSLKNSSIDWNDPNLRQQLALLAKHPDLLKLKPDEIDKLRQKLPPIMPPGMGDPQPPPGLPPMPPTGNPPGGEPPPTTLEPPVSQDPGREDAEEVMRWLGRRLEGLSDWVDDSPALQRMIRRLGDRLDLDGSFLNNLGGEEGIDQQLARWSRWARNTGNWLEGFAGPLGDIDLPRWRWGGTGGSAGPALPRAGDVRQAAAFWPVLAWIIVVGMLVWAAWRLALPRLGRLPELPGWQLGPWPVRPEAVSSRAELIQTFEYLSLLRLGEPAQCWNHRHIARQLERESADRLASLYEQARYAPGDEPLTSEQLAKARRDLVELAHEAK